MFIEHCFVGPREAISASLSSSKTTSKRERCLARYDDPLGNLLAGSKVDGPLALTKSGLGHTLVQPPEVASRLASGGQSWSGAREHATALARLQVVGGQADGIIQTDDETDSHTSE